MSKIAKKQFLADVRHEIDMLKLYATDAEKERLDFETFKPSSVSRCIYGQLTYSCESMRAKELMDLSCIRVFSPDWLQMATNELSDLVNHVNGRYTQQDWVFDERRLLYFSALEGYIYASDAKNAQIIAYIKGETETLVL